MPNEVEIKVPQLGANDEFATIVSWEVNDGEFVEIGKVIATIETTKTVFEVESSQAGYILKQANLNNEVSTNQTIALVFESRKKLELYESKPKLAEQESNHKSKFIITEKAKKLAKENNIDIGTLSATVGGIVREKDVEVIIKRKSQKAYDGNITLKQVGKKIERIILLGGGLAASQVLSILKRQDGKIRDVVGILDDTEEKWGSFFADIPIAGPISILNDLKDKGLFDSVLISISAPVSARESLRIMCKEIGLPLSDSVIDPSTVIGSNVEIGKGNIICANCHFGNDTTIEENNFISAYNSFDHHNSIGSDCSTGPGCIFSGSVEIKNKVRLGTGIFIEPKIVLGENVSVASGSIITKSIEKNHTVKSVISNTAIFKNKK